MGMDHFLIALLEEPKKVKELLHEISKYNKRVFADFMEMGADAVTFSEDLGTQRSLMFSPDIFKEVFLPEYRYIFGDLTRENKIINFHSCGCVNDIIPYLADIGVTILNPIQSRANDIEKAKNDALGKMALCGGVDSHLLLTGSVRQVKDETLRVMEILKPNGGYICAPDQYFPNFPAENITALYETAIQYGKY